MTLTAVGEAFLPEARRAVGAVRRAREVGRRAVQGLDGELRVGYAQDIGPRLFQLAVPALVARIGAVQVVPVPMTTPDQLSELREQRLDLAFGMVTTIGARPHVSAGHPGADGRGHGCHPSARLGGLARPSRPVRSARDPGRARG